MKTVVVGRPGTGKTQYLMGLLNTADPARTIFISYTRSAVQEARARAEAKWGVKAKDIIYFRTIHSLCSLLMGLGEGSFLREEKIREFMKSQGLEYAERREMREALEDGGFGDGDMDALPDGNRVVGLVNRIKNVECCGLGSLDGEVIDRYISEFLGGARMRNPKFDSMDMVRNLLFEFEAMRGDALYYPDILLRFLVSPVAPEVENLIVDEFQDVSPLTYRIVKYFEAHTRNQWYAGDPHQAIYDFIGASPRFLLQEQAQADFGVTLPKSWRLKKKIYELATAVINNNCRDKIRDRLEVGDGGGVRYFGSEAEVVAELHGCRSSVFILTRTNAKKRHWADLLQREGIVFGLQGRGKRIWNQDMLNANDFIYCARLGLPMPQRVAREYLLELVPSSPFLRRGAKAEIRKGERLRGEMVKVEDFRGVLAIGQTVMDIADLLILKLSPEEKEVLGIKLEKNPGVAQRSVVVGTIHSVKGMETDLVVYDAELPERIEKEAYSNGVVAEAEARVAYVAVTRAREQVWIINSNMVIAQVGQVVVW